MSITFSIGQKWPNGFGDNLWWVSTMGAAVQRGGGTTLTAGCKSIEELEAEVERLKEGLDDALKRAREVIAAADKPARHR